MAKEKASQEEIYRQLRGDIEAGAFPASTRLPSVRTLAKRFNASPNTISKVVSRLMESGLCTARRGVGLFVRGLPTRKLTLLVGSKESAPGGDFNGIVESRMCERLMSEGIEVERYHITGSDPVYGPAVERIRRPGRVVVCIGLTHEPHLKALGELRRPMLVIGHTPSRSTSSSVVPNSFRSGYLAARHLVRSGFRRVAYIGKVRRVRQVVLPEPEALKAQAGVQCAFLEEGLKPDPAAMYSDVEDFLNRFADGERPDAVIIPQSEDDLKTIQVRKALDGQAPLVLIGDDRIESHSKHPVAVVVKIDDVVDIAVMEIKRLLDEQRAAPRSYIANTELVDAAG